MSDELDNEEYMSEQEYEAAVQEMSEESEAEAYVDVSDDVDLEADLQILKDASLRLEQGNLYKMLLKHDLFDGVEADPRAVANVQREIRTFIRERLEILVGLKTDPKLERQQSNTGFSQEEIALLKAMLSKVVNKDESKLAPLSRAAKPGLNQVKTKEAPKAIAKVRPEAKPQAPAPKLTKAVKDMSPDEIIEYNRSITAKQALKKASPIKKMPMPDAQQIATMYSSRVNTDPGQGLVGMIMNKMGVQVGTMETVDSPMGDDNNSRI